MMTYTACRKAFGLDQGCDRYPSPVYAYGIRNDGPLAHISSSESKRADLLHTGRMRRQVHRLVGMANETLSAKAPF